jgi:PHD/YefM family antitoxin component YafN of YafNO toxin-antitoxin module
MSESPESLGTVVGDHQVIIRAGQVEAVVVPLKEYRALELRETELYWAVHEARYASRPGDDVPEGKAYDSMDALLTDLDLPE